MGHAEQARNPVLRRALEQRGARASNQTHEYAAKRIVGFLDPVLAALSVPEQLLVVLDGASSAEPYTRRILSYPPLLETVGKGADRQDYHVSVTDGQLPNGIKFPLAITTADSWDNIPMGSVVDNDGYPTVRNAVGNIANVAEIEDLVDLAAWVSKEAPRQALMNGQISPNWMNRYMLDELHPGYPFLEGIPTVGESRRMGLFEVIKGTGGRAVCHLDATRRLGPVWIDDVSGNVFTGSEGAIAWRNVSRIIQPRYYLEQKFPDLFKKS